MVLAPEHELLDEITTDEHRDEVEAYREQALQKSERKRKQEDEKTGVFTGGHAVNPVNGEEIPIWVADYVLASYGTGAIMAVPAHDERDYTFAETYGLPIREVVEGSDIDEEAYVGDGPHVNSANEGVSLNGLHNEEAKERVTEWLEQEEKGEHTVNYQLQDWLFSRQRYWGEPFPILFTEDGEDKPVPEDDLPVTLPDIDTFEPSGTPEGPLATIEDWVKTTDPETGEPATRETNTMPQWAGSCWYYLRFIDPDNDDRLVDPEKEEYWMPVDLYVGGSEHAVLHLLYARFWHKVLYDAGVVSTKEPFQTLVHQGIILGEKEYAAFVDANGHYVSAEHVEDGVDTRTGEAVDREELDEDDVEKEGDAFVLKERPEIRVDAQAHKMSKSRGNVVNPDDVVDEYGADALRMYEMFMGPLEQTKAWDTDDVEGVFRFLNRVWRLVVDEDTGELAEGLTDEDPGREHLHELHQTIKKVTEDIEERAFNTAIAAMMEFVNTANKWDPVPRQIMEPFVLLLSPFAPHLSEELWARLGHDESLAYADWPEYEEALLQREVVEMAVQVDGTVRATIEVDADAPEDDVLATAKAEDNVARHLDGKDIQREIYVPGQIVNFVTG
jgi:leucyl-tRNA synthetase